MSATFLYKLLNNALVTCKHNSETIISDTTGKGYD